MSQPPRSAVIQHTPADRLLQPAETGPNAGRIAAHIEQHIGAPEFVHHELVSDLVHLDIHIIPPAPRRKFYALVTSGMSDLAMDVPEGIAAPRFAELMLCLPPEWPLPLDTPDWAGLDERVVWPVRLLRALARLPHEHGTWLGFGHTIPNGDPPRPYAPNTRLCGAMLGYPVAPKPPFRQLKIDQQTTIAFFSVIPLFQQEIEHKLRHGAAALAERLGRKGIGEVLDISRRNVCKAWWRWW
ncbi:MAG: suppressor of fused domain protein [Tepidisphaeraceae bacterium]|jgi:hypothetical protein